MLNTSSPASATAMTPSTAKEGARDILYDQVISGNSILVYAAFLLIPLATALLYRTGWGLRLRAVGENPEAVASAGLNVVGLRLQALLVNGALVGVAGAFSPSPPTPATPAT